MDIQRINHMLVKAIGGLQEEELLEVYNARKADWRRVRQSAHGSTHDLMKPLDSVLSSLVQGSGKLTDPNRTPDLKAVHAVLVPLLRATKELSPKERKEVLADLRDWLKTAREHAKRLEQALHKPNDVGYDEVNAARQVRDLLDQARGLVTKMRGGGGQAPRKTVPQRVQGPSEWTKQKVKIRAGLDDEMVDAEVIGVWAVHRTFGQGKGRRFTVTHVPSGMAANQNLKSAKAAKNAVEKMLAAAPDLRDLKAVSQLQKYRSVVLDSFKD